MAELPESKLARRWWSIVGAIVLALLAMVTVFRNLGVAPPGRMSEQRCHRVAARMESTGDWLVPVDHGEIRLQKPPLYYWLAAASIALTNDVTYAVTRFPSALAALLLLALTFAWGRTLGGPLAGFLAAALLLAMDQFQDNGRRGDAEMTLALTSVAAVMLFQRAARSACRIDLAAFGIALALAFLAKATAAIVVVLVPVLAMTFVDERARKRLDLAFVGVVGGAMAVGFAWHCVIAVRVPDAMSAFLGHAVRPFGIDDPGGDAGHFKSWYFFVKALPSITTPVIVLLPLLLAHAWRTRWFAGDRSLRAVAACFVAQFVAFSLLPQKQAHYLLPALPALAVMLGVEIVRRLRQEGERSPNIGLRVALALAAASVAGYAVAEIAWSRVFIDHAAPLVTSFAVLAFGLAVVATMCVRRDRITTAACLVIVALALVCSVHAADIMPWRANLADAVENHMATPERIRATRVVAERPLLAAVFDVSDALAPEEP